MASPTALAETVGCDDAALDCGQRLVVALGGFQHLRQPERRLTRALATYDQQAR